VYTTGTDTTPSDNTYQYTGRENDQNGLYYYRNRFLLPGVGAFASEDPMGFAAGQNLYLYTKANPINYIDPLGLDEVTSPVYVSLSITGSAAAVVGIALVCGVDPPVGLVLIIEVGGQLMEAGHIYQEGKGVVGPSAK
jgi:RHS repeat-associated protein